MIHGVPILSLYLFVSFPSFLVHPPVPVDRPGRRWTEFYRARVVSYDPPSPGRLLYIYAAELSTPSISVPVNVSGLEFPGLESVPFVSLSSTAIHFQRLSPTSNIDSPSCHLRMWLRRACIGPKSITDRPPWSHNASKVFLSSDPAPFQASVRFLPISPNSLHVRPASLLSYNIWAQSHH